MLAPLMGSNRTDETLVRIHSTTMKLFMEDLLLDVDAQNKNDALFRKTSETGMYF